MIENLNIIVPCAGRSQRFKDQGIPLPKQLVEIKGRKVIEWAISSLPRGQFIFVVHAEQNEQYGLGDVLRSIVPDCIIIETPDYTEGPACTALLAEDYMDDFPLIVADSDFHTVWNHDKFFDHVHKHRYDACALVEISQSEKNSYVRMENDLIVEAVEKQVISDISPHGIHYYRKGSIFREGAYSLIGMNRRYKQEYFIAPIYQELATLYYRCGIYFSEKHYPLGTPEDIEKFKVEYRCSQ